jgi:elongation factor G
LKGITQARGRFSMTFVGYEEVPGHLVDQVVAQHKKELEASAH